MSLTINQRTAGRPASFYAWAAALLSAATLVGAWVFQYGLLIPPCPLCLLQRYAYYVAIPLAFVVALAAARGAAVRWLKPGFALLALIWLGSAVFAAYHAGIEWKFWPGPADCTGPLNDLGTAGGLLNQLDSIRVVRCDEIPWSLFGISLAGYNVLISLALALVSWGGWRAAR